MKNNFSKLSALIICLILSLMTLFGCGGKTKTSVNDSTANDKSSSSITDSSNTANSNSTTSSSSSESHIHTYSSSWDSDDVNHWHQASCEHSAEKSDLAPHTFGEPIVTKKASVESLGELSYTCTVCGKTVIEPIEFVDFENLDSFTQNLIDNSSNGRPAWNRESFKDRWNYIDGVFLNSIVSSYYENLNFSPEKAEKYKNFFISFINYYINKNGVFTTTSGSGDGFLDGELDSICESKILFDAYAMTGDSRYITAINSTYTSLMKMDRAGDTVNFSHKNSYADQIWLDGMYMYAPYYARYALANNKSEIFSELKTQYQYIREHMYNSEKGLYYHGHDTTKKMSWADDTTGNSSNFWIRAEGWYIVSLVDIIEYFPDGSEKTYLLGLLKEAIDGILQYQDAETKMFYQVIDAVDSQGKPLSAGGNTNYVESSGSSMIAYAVLKASNKGYIADSYKEIGATIFRGVYEHSFDSTTNSLNDICITAGLGGSANRDGSLDYYLSETVGSNDAKGVGPFLMAYLEYRFGGKADNRTTPLFNKTHTVSYQVNGGTAISDDTIFEGQTYRAKATSKDGFKLVGWFTDSNLTKDFDNNARITTDITLYAKWEQLKAELVYSQDFESYTTGEKLSTTVSTKEPYATRNDTSNWVEIINSKLNITGKSAILSEASSSTNKTTELYVPYEISSGVYSIELDVMPIKTRTSTSSEVGTVNKWTFVEFYGTNIYFRTNNDSVGKLCVCVGSTENYTYVSNETYSDRTAYHIEIIFDYSNNLFSFNLNGEKVVENETFSGNTFSALKLITANSDNKRAITVDNIKIYKY